MNKKSGVYRQIGIGVPYNMNYIHRRDNQERDA